MTEENKEKESLQEDINKKVIKKPSVKIKKSFVLALIAVVIVVVTYAFINASIKVKKANDIQKSKEENKEEVTKKTVSNFDFLESDYSKLKKMEEEEKTYRELVKTEIEEKKVDDSVLGPNIKMEEYYTQLLQEEMQSRLSDIDYSIISRNNNVEKKDNSEEKVENINLDSEYNKYSLKEAKSSYELKAGSFIPGILVSGVDSQIEGKMIGLVRENVYDSIIGKYLLIPKGTKIVGEYSSGVAYGQDRVFIIWQRLIFPNGKSLLLENFPGVDLSAYAGMRGRVNNHNIELFKSVILSSILGGGTALVDRNKDTRIQSWENAMASGAGERILDIGDSLVERILNIKPTITIKPGSRFNIIVNADLILEPYKE